MVVSKKIIITSIKIVSAIEQSIKNNKTHYNNRPRIKKERRYINQNNKGILKQIKDFK